MKLKKEKEEEIEKREQEKNNFEKKIRELEE